MVRRYPANENGDAISTLLESFYRGFVEDLTMSNKNPASDTLTHVTKNACAVTEALARVKNSVLLRTGSSSSRSSVKDAEQRKRPRVFFASSASARSYDIHHRGAVEEKEEGEVPAHDSGGFQVALHQYGGSPSDAMATDAAIDDDDRSLTSPPPPTPIRQFEDNEIVFE
jgi:hypothetical protein